MKDERVIEMTTQLELPVLVMETKGLDLPLRTKKATAVWIAANAEAFNCDQAKTERTGDKQVELHGTLLSSNEQYFWGFAGGCLVLLFRLWVYANNLAPDNAWPSANFKTCLLCIAWGAFPFASGVVSRICDPHHRFIAVFEGASGPALFLLVAKDFPL